MTAIECQGIVKRFGSVKALDNLDLEIERNGIFGLLGPNGAGKTTLIRILTGLTAPTSGSCRVFGTPVGDAGRDHRYRIGYLSQDPTYYPWMTGRELLHFVGRLFGMPRTDIRTRTEELLAMAGLTDAADRRIRGYSGGMVQRLGIAQALFHRPGLLFLDEPVSALDPIGRKEVLEFIASLGSDISVCMSTHILADVERICSSVAIMDRGRVKLVGRTASLLAGHSGGMTLLSFSRNEDAERLSRRLSGGAAAESPPLGPSESLDTASSDSATDVSPALVPHTCEEGVLRLASELFERNRTKILGLILEDNLSLRSITSERAALEEVFVELIQGGPHAQ